MQSPSNFAGPRSRRSLVLPPVSPIQEPSSPVESILADLSDVVRIVSDGEAASSSADSDDSLLLGSTGAQGDAEKSALDETLETISRALEDSPASLSSLSRRSALLRSEGTVQRRALGMAVSGPIRRTTQGLPPTSSSVVLGEAGLEGINPLFNLSSHASSTSISPLAAASTPNISSLNTRRRSSLLRKRDSEPTTLDTVTLDNLAISGPDRRAPALPPLSGAHSTIGIDDSSDPMAALREIQRNQAQNNRQS